MKILSDSIMHSEEAHKIYADVIPATNVCLFIEKIKAELTMDGFGHHTSETLDKIIKRDIIKTIDKLAGEKLI